MFEKSRASLELPSESAFFSPIRSLFQRNLNYEGTSHVEDHFEFICSVRFYNQHLRMMQLSFSTISSFLDMMQNKATLKEISPLEMEKLRNVELNGVFSWLDSITAYKHLSSADQENLLKRYSIRKVSLDRFYIASLHVYELQRKNFVLNNNTFIPPNRTGFEVVEEDEKQIKFKNETFAETNARSWKNVVLRFTDLSIKDAEVVYLQYMLLWSVANYAYVSGDAKKMMKDQRNRVMSNLFEYYSLSKTEEPEVRFAEITMLLGELEEVFDMHCLDIQIFEVFGLSGLGNTWYVDVCHSQLNNPRLEWDFNMIENLKDLNFRNIQECAKKWKISCLNE
ncbi:unnamed protein product [Auanema sp. JU1783]|nr:unnamed protein product [Auanema sp. JU1783]